MENKDQNLWRIAKKRAAFKTQLFAYFVVNAFLWAIWFFTIGRRGYGNALPWPIWPMLGWGIGLAFSYYDAYNGSKDSLIEKEYEKLKKEQETK